MNSSKPHRAAIAQARGLLTHLISENLCQDTWGASPGAPPTEHSNSVFLMYFATRALHVSGGVEPAIANVILGHIERARKGVAYAYDRLSPPDADDTAFAFRTRLLLEGETAVADVARALEPFALRGSWQTFCGPLAPAPGWTIEYRDDASIFGLHPEVHLNVSLLLRASQLQKSFSVGGLPTRDGLIVGYHYPSVLYPTWLAMELMAEHPSAVYLDDAIAAKQGPDGGWPKVIDGFSREQETALALLSLSENALHSRVGDRGLQFLLTAQQPDGGWGGGVLWTYRVPRTGGQTLWWAEDSQRIVSTSLGLSATQRHLDGL